MIKANLLAGQRTLLEGIPKKMIKIYNRLAVNGKALN